MPLTQYAAVTKRAIFDDLLAGIPPRQGEFSEAVLSEGRSKGRPQMGATNYEPDAILMEFIYPDPKGSAVLLSVRVSAPERIVFMPVPEWVVESIWQGEIAGSYHFEGDALRMIEEFRASLAPEANAEIFGQERAVAGRG